MKYLLLWLGLALLLIVPPGRSQEDSEIWITIGQDVIEDLKTSLRDVNWQEEIRLFKKGEVAVTKIKVSHLPRINELMHHKFNRCGGFIAHDSQEAALAAAISQTGEVAVNKRLMSYTIDNAAVAQTLINGVEEAQIIATVTTLSNYTTRYYTTQGGVDSGIWLRDLWAGFAQGRGDVSVELYQHSGYPQASVILTIQGAAQAGEVVVLGAHLDSTAGSAGSTAPGADDDASGVATLTEVIRVALANDFKPEKTVKFMAYAAEEVGLRGSGDIASSFSAAGTNVVGVLQLDMVNYNGSVEDIVLIDDFTNAAQNQFIGNLIDTYLGLNWTYSSCGYGCSDHASWTNAGFVASIPFESRFGEHNPTIHTSSDTLAVSGGGATHALKFAKLAGAYLAELAKGDFSGDPGGGPGNPPVPQTQNFSGSLATGEIDQFGPFSVEAGTNFQAVISGSGDADLYVRFGSAPTTSSYDCRPYLNGSSETCSLTVPGGQTEAYVMVRGYSSSSYNLTVTHTPAAGGGDPGNPGDPTVQTVNLSGNLARRATDHYGPYEVVAGSTVRAVLSPNGGSGDADLYVRFGSAPTTGSYDCRPYLNGSNETCELTVPAGQSQVYLIIRGYSAASYAVELTYTTP